MNASAEQKSSWEIFLAELDHWIAQHGTLSQLRQKDLGRDNYELGKRVRGIRQQYKRGALTDQQIAELQARPGWHWNPRYAAWLAQFEAARDFFEQDTDDKMPGRVGDWLYQVRRAHQEDRLTQDQVALLHTVPEILHTGAAAALARDLQTWLELNPNRGLSDITRDDKVAGSRLMRRVIYVRHRYHDGLLLDWEQDMLEDLPGWRW